MITEWCKDQSITGGEEMCFQPLACGWLQDHSTVGAYLLLPEDWAKSPFGQRAPRDHELPYPAGRPSCSTSPRAMGSTVPS